MTDGEKMIWAAVFGRTDHENARHTQAHREQAATLAAEAATRGVEAARAIKTEDIDDETAEMMSSVFECDGPDDE